ncbi:hypothetical protein [Brevibacterium sediminis]
MTDHSPNPTSTTGHVWPCIGFYQLSTEKDRTDRCTCGENARTAGSGGEPRKRWPMWLGWLGARTGRAVSEDVAGRYQPVTVYQRPASKVRQLLGLGAWVAAVGYVVAWVTNSRILINAVDWVREAPAEQVAGGTVALVIFWASAKLIGLGIRVGQHRYRYVYVTSTEAEAMRAPEALVFRKGAPGRGTSVDLGEG